MAVPAEATIGIWRCGRADEAQAACDIAAGAAVFAGGATALQLSWPAGAVPRVLIPVGGIADAHGCAVVDRWLRIGAADTLEQVRCDPRVTRDAPLLAHACAAVGSPAVRNLATIGGNVGWRHGDALAALLALDAHALPADGRWRPLPEVLAQPALPLIVALRVALDDGADPWCFEKVGLRAAFTPSRLTLAVRRRARRGDWFVAATSATMTARRLSEVERLLADANGTDSGTGMGTGDVTGTRNDTGNGTGTGNGNGGSIWRHDDLRPAPPSSALRAACARDLADAPELAGLAARLIDFHRRELDR